MLLGKPEIEKYIESGDIIIDPFVPENLGSAQYDVTLGEHIYRENELSNARFYNPFDENHVRRKWESDRAITHEDFVERFGVTLNGVRGDDKLILVAPGETILAHTNEFIGGACAFITTMMKARSSMGRNFFEVCKCLPAETEVRRANGAPALIGELRVGDRLLNVDRNGNSRTATVKAVRRSGAKKVITAKTVGGRVITCSVDHLLRVSRSDGLHTIQAADLHNGDEMPVLRRWEPDAPITSSFGPSVAEATLLGYFVAEGNWSQYRLSFAKAIEKSEERAQIAEAMKAVFPDAPEPKRDETQMMYNSVDLARAFAQRYPETSCLGHSKRVPHCLFSASLASVRAFLAAYLRCDGHDRKSQDEVQTCSRSFDLIRDVALLAARVGAVPGFHQRHTGAADRLQSYGMYYGDDAGRIANRVTDAVRGQNVFIPDLLDSVRKKYGLTRADLGGYAPTDRKRISRKRLDSIVAAHSIEELRPYTSDMAWDSVVSIETQAIERFDMVDISLDVETEEDSLFVLGDGLMVLNCAGMGDVGYFNRWTMEITNNSRYHTIPLVVGRRVAQLLFFKVAAVDFKDQYEVAGKYQSSASLADLKRDWTPEQMLPKQWRDRECRVRHAPNCAKFHARLLGTPPADCSCGVEGK